MRPWRVLSAMTLSVATTAAAWAGTASAAFRVNLIVVDRCTVGSIDAALAMPARTSCVGSSRFEMAARSEQRPLADGWLTDPGEAAQTPAGQGLVSNAAQSGTGRGSGEAYPVAADADQPAWRNAVRVTVSF